MGETAQNLGAILVSLRSEYPDVGPPKLAGVLEIILFENVAYLVSDKRRASVWSDFCSRVGTDPAEILATDPEFLIEVLQPGGMHPTRRAEKVLTICAIIVEEFDGDASTILALAEKERRKALKKFPGFGDPGADKILLLTKTEKILALDSNGLRVLLRLGFGEAAKSYSTTYRSVQNAVRDQLPEKIGDVIRGHFLLRRHGQEICKNNQPRCAACGLASRCPSATT